MSENENREIVKVQRSLFPRGKVLIYNKSQTIFREDDLTEEINEFMGDDDKIFCYAHISKDKKIVLSERADDQWW